MTMYQRTSRSIKTLNLRYGCHVTRIDGFHNAKHLTLQHKRTTKSCRSVEQYSRLLHRLGTKTTLSKYKQHKWSLEINLQSLGYL